MNIIRHAQEENNARIDRTVFPLYFSAENVLQAIAPPRASLDLYGDLSRIYGDLSVWGSVVTGLDFFSHGDNHPGDKSGVRINRSTA
jgi:hypothetical protein